MKSFSWTCPYCNQNATITDENYSENEHRFNKNNKDKDLSLLTGIVTCPNEKCKEYSIVADLYKCHYANGFWFNDEVIKWWRLKPQSISKQYPDYVPAAIKADYEEACLIKDLSPKASATLSRRCIQGILRDFWKVKGRTLFDEIKQIEDKIDPITLEAIHAVRDIGNIGAHMEKDIDLIIDVDPEEAQLLIGLIEILIKDWYINRFERKQHLENIIKVAEAKKEEKINL